MAWSVKISTKIYFGKRLKLSGLPQKLPMVALFVHSCISFGKSDPLLHSSQVDRHCLEQLEAYQIKLFLLRKWNLLCIEADIATYGVTIDLKVCVMDHVFTLRVAHRAVGGPVAGRIANSASLPNARVWEGTFPLVDLYPRWHFNYNSTLEISTIQCKNKSRPGIWKKNFPSSSEPEISFVSKIFISWHSAIASGIPSKTDKSRGALLKKNLLVIGEFLAKSCA